VQVQRRQESEVFAGGEGYRTDGELCYYFSSMYVELKTQYYLITLCILSGPVPVFLLVAVPNRSQILEWISTIPYTSHHRRISEDRLDGTGQWLLAREEYSEWRVSRRSKLLLLRGIRKLSYTPIFAIQTDTKQLELEKHTSRK
jgi:hypothetical protein